MATEYYTDSMLNFSEISNLFIAFSLVLIKIKSFGFLFWNADVMVFPCIHSLDKKTLIFGLVVPAFYKAYLCLPLL